MRYDKVEYIHGQKLYVYHTTENETNYDPVEYNGNFLHGMQIIHFKRENIFEVSEYQAGDKKELFVYGEYRYLKNAVRSMLKGNHETTGRKPIKIF